jgi:hypothetical protein
MASPAQVIAQLIRDKGLGNAHDHTTWPVSVGFMADSPHNAITVYGTEGRQDGRLMKTGERIEHPGIQVRVRSLKYTDGRAKADAIALMFDTQSSGVTVAIPADGSYFIQNVSRTGSVIELGPNEEDPNRRLDFTVNAVLTLRKL